MVKAYSKVDALNAFKSVGIVRGDIVFVSTSLGLLGLLEGATSNEELNATFFKVLKELIGPEGTIIVPTYSYTFGKSEEKSLANFSVENTPAEVGPFPEFFRNQAGVIRTNDPFMSVAIWGRLKNELASNLPNTSYGHDCIFSRLLKYNSKCLNIGLGPNWMAFIHHLEYLHNVPFRYDKEFSGLINGVLTKWIYTVPTLDDYSIANAHDIARLSEKEGVWETSNLGRGRIYCCDYKAYFNFVSEHLESDKWLLAQGPKCNVFDSEKERANTHQDNANEVEICHKLNEMIRKIATRCDLKIYRKRTGEWLGGELIPEGWYRGKLEVFRGEKLVFNDSSYIAPYSSSFEGVFEGKEIQKFYHDSLYFKKPTFKLFKLKTLPIPVTNDVLYYIKAESGYYLSELILAYEVETQAKQVNFLYVDIECNKYLDVVKSFPERSSSIVSSSLIALNFACQKNMFKNATHLTLYISKQVEKTFPLMVSAKLEELGIKLKVNVRIR